MEDALAWAVLIGAVVVIGTVVRVRREWRIAANEDLPPPPKPERRGLIGTLIDGIRAVCWVAALVVLAALIL